MTPSETTEFFKKAVADKDQWVFIADFETGLLDLDKIAEDALFCGADPSEITYERVIYTRKDLPIPTRISWFSIKKESFPFEDVVESLMQHGAPYKQLTPTAVFVVLTESREGPAVSFVTNAVYGNITDPTFPMN